MNEQAINAQFAMLMDQRNSAMNQVVNLAGQAAIDKARIAELEKALEAAQALVAEKAEVVEVPVVDAPQKGGTPFPKVKHKNA